MTKSADAFRTISEVAELLDTPAHVLRFWESRFPQVKPVKRAGGRRYYRPADVALLGGIKALLHEDGLTIRGVQKLLKDLGPRHVAAMADSDERATSAARQATTDPETGLAIESDGAMAAGLEDISPSALPPARIAPTTVEALNADTPTAHTPAARTDLPSATVTPLAPAARKEAVEAAAPADMPQAFAPDAGQVIERSTPDMPAPDFPDAAISNVGQQPHMTPNVWSEVEAAEFSAPSEARDRPLSDPPANPPAADAPSEPLYADPVQEYDEAPMIIDAQDELIVAEVISFPPNASDQAAQDRARAAQMDLFGTPVPTDAPQDDDDGDFIDTRDDGAQDDIDAAAHSTVSESPAPPPQLASAVAAHGEATVGDTTAAVLPESAPDAPQTESAAGDTLAPIAQMPNIGSVAKALRRVPPLSCTDSDRALARDLLARAAALRENLQTRPATQAAQGPAPHGA